MILDDLKAMQAIDVSRMIDEITGLPDQLLRAQKLADQYTIPDWSNIENIVIAGMGGSAIAGDLISAYLSSNYPLPIFIHRDYGLPAWVSPAKTLVICSSHSGNTEETISSYEAAKNKGCRAAVITTGGKLASRVKASEDTIWTFSHAGQPRSAVGYGFVLLLNLLCTLVDFPSPGEMIRKTTELLSMEQKIYRPESEVANNPAKRQAGQMIDRNILFIGSGIMAPVGRRWKGQVNELAKAPASFDVLPEADHNSLAGTMFPESLLSRTITVFINNPSASLADQKRLALTRKSFMLAGIGTDTYTTSGKTPLEQLWSAIQFGDYLAYYLAMLYHVDPTPIEAIQNFKSELHI